MRGVVVFDRRRELDRQRFGDFHLTLGALTGLAGKIAEAVADAERRKDDQNQTEADAGRVSELENICQAWPYVYFGSFFPKS